MIPFARDGSSLAIRLCYNQDSIGRAILFSLLRAALGVP
jgi:hypothetical protein